MRYACLYRADDQMCLLTVQWCCASTHVPQRLKEGERRCVHPGAALVFSHYCFTAVMAYILKIQFWKALTLEFLLSKDEADRSATEQTISDYLYFILFVRGLSIDVCCPPANTR